jgi:hypothetical protein
MKKPQLLSFISDEKLFEQVKRVLDVAKASSSEADGRLFTNTIDPFSALFDAMCQGISLKQWLEQEKARQTQKTLQNALGEFHQEILGSIPGWVSLGKGNVFDLKNDSLKIIAEVKNKYNTTKGNHKVAIYDDLSGQLKTKYKDYTAYYVEIIPKSRVAYDKPFTPSDNRTHERRAARKDIRVIDGKSFYGLATDDPEAISKFYEVLPIVIKKLLRADNPGGEYSQQSFDVGMSRDLPKRNKEGNYPASDADCEYTKLFERVY